MINKTKRGCNSKTYLINIPMYLSWVKRGELKW